MPNTNPQAIKIANEKIRPLADALAKVYDLSREIGLLAIAQNWNGIIPNDATVVADGADVDGRQPVTNGQLQIVLAHAAALVSDFEAASKLKLNQILAVAVNTHA